MEDYNPGVHLLINNRNALPVSWLDKEKAIEYMIRKKVELQNNDNKIVNVQQESLFDQDR
jgi:hypothetical protein